jgi:hypothetical protein
MDGGAITPNCEGIWGAKQHLADCLRPFGNYLRALASNFIAGAYVSESSGVLSAFVQEALWAHWARTSGMR